ncbi:MAG TPA: ABC transporter permease subunit [Clostridia bacterium]|jgi:putative aldouronate transport system permease protein
MINNQISIKKQKNQKRKLLLHRIKVNKQIYIMLIPVVIFYILFCYVPMPGIILAWKKYRHTQGIFGSPWVGWSIFEKLFTHPDMMRAIKNTLVISGLKLVFCFPAPIILALLLNEIKNKTYKKSIQTMIYLPNFISWVIIGGLIKSMLSYDEGLMNNLIVLFGGNRIQFMTTSKYFYPILILSEIWKGTGWGTIIYIAAISNINPTLYEAAAIDGCKRFGAIWHVTLPSILPIIAVMLIIQLSNIMNAGFDPVYNLYNPIVYDVSDIIDTMLYRLGVEKGQLENATAIGLFKNVINFALLITGNYATKKLSGYSMYSLD